MGPITRDNLIEVGVMFEDLLNAPDSFVSFFEKDSVN